MAYAFRIHEPKKVGDPAPTAASTMAGWTETAHIAGNLLGNIPLGMNSNKMGTSIPSLFARIFLFEGAFQTLRGCAINTLRQVDSDTALVSECLDLIEFIYQHGNDPKLVIKHWNATEQIHNLRNDGFPEHAKLAKVIEDEISLYPQLQDIYLFFWKDATSTNLNPQEFLIGGTSPYTLVFTSPNWLRCVKEKNFSFNRINGRPLFCPNDIESLETRDNTFKDMLYSLRMAYQPELSSQAPSFNQYITTIWNANNRPQPTSINKGNFMATFSNITDINGANVQSAMLPLCYKQVQPTASGYEIIPKSNRYKNYTAKDGSMVTLDVPLALNDNGLGDGVAYVGTSVWDARTCHINEAAIRDKEMHRRELPGAIGSNYPFLIWSDFLEDKIIKLPYKINAQSFDTAFDGETQYILPLKRTFFKYFNIDDISQNACQGLNKKLVEIKVNGDTVAVTINVPIRDTTYRLIEFKKEYTGSDVINGNFLLGFFPFYRSDDDRLNRYSIMNCGSGARLSFVSIKNLDQNVESSSTIRTPQQKLVSQTEYYLVKTSFDLVEVSIGGVKGIIVPQMQKVGPVTNHYKFAVDFGTSNTYIAHTTSAQPIPETLEIDDHDQQTIYLNKANDFGDLTMMRPFMAREFAPVHLGANFDISYPARTATCETNNFESNTPDLFGTISIGFNMMHEPQALNIFKYKTGLKWLLEEHPGDQHHTNRVKFYFLQTLWMLKNESLMNDGDDTFDVYITFPEAMKDQETLMNLWNWAKEELNINCNFFYGTEYSESIAPYNCMATQIGGSSFLNIDIGGGTNDLLFVNKDANGHIVGAHYSSSMFAGDDLWGDGIQISNNAQLNNGFVEYVMGEIEKAVQTYKQEILSPLRSLKGGVTTSSADVMGYLFKYDNVFQTSAKIKGQRNLYSIVFIHYAALMYNVSRLIKKMGIEIPLKLSFTGMGSKYINLISTNPQTIKKLTVLLLEKYTGKKADSAFTIICAKNAQNENVDVKEITAKGVLEGLSLNTNFQIPSQTLSPIVDYGFDRTGELTYADVSTDEVRVAALESFNHFIDSLQDRDFANFIFTNFKNLTISKDLIADLRKFAKQSFVTMSANIPDQYKDLNVTETLFFWPLKNSLVELSKNYAMYN